VVGTQDAAEVGGGFVEDIIDGGPGTAVLFEGEGSCESGDASSDDGDASQIDSPVAVKPL
jgi:hypothetical protein